MKGRYKIKRSTALQSAFAALRGQKIIVAQKHLCCGGCASADLFQRAERMSKRGLEVKGAVYFHEQDFEHAMSDGQLYIGYGGFGDVDDKDIAKRITDALEVYHVPYKWDGNTSTRILITLSRAQS